MSHIGEFELIGRIAALSCQPAGSSCYPAGSSCNIEDPSSNIAAPSCTPADPSCHPEPSLCHPERSEGSPSPSGIIGIGDDCAVIPQHFGLDTLVTTDLLIEGRHFLLEDITPYELGWKSAAVNISDIAAMGGRPTSAFLSIALPDFSNRPDLASLRHSRPDRESLEPSSGHPEPPFCHPERSEGSPSPLTEWMDGFIAGFNALCGKYGVRLLGGDTSASDDKLFINVTLLGECPHGRAILRSGARAGDIIYVTGPLGDSAAGLKLILERSSALPGRPTLDGQEAKTAFFDAGAPTSGRPGSTSVAAGAPSVNPGPPSVGSDTPSVILSEAKNLDPSAGLRMTGPSAALGSTPTTIDQTLIRRHYLPEPRVALGQQLAAIPGVHSMMDISDGIASDLRHILNASSAEIAGQAGNDANHPFPGDPAYPFPDDPVRHVLTDPVRPVLTDPACPVLTDPARHSLDAPPRHSPADQFRHSRPDRESPSSEEAPSGACQVDSPLLAAEIDLRSIPLSDELRTLCANRGWDPFELAVSGGEDYELLFTAAPDCKVPEGCVAIGRIVDSRSEPGMTDEELEVTGAEPEVTDVEPGMADAEQGTTGRIRWIGSDKEFKGFTHF